MQRIYSSLTEAIGNTPLVEINHSLCTPCGRILAKMEMLNPGGSVKDRAGISMIEDAEKRGWLKKDSVIIEPTSGNTGISLAWIGATKGYKVLLTMPETLSIERRQLLKALGAELVLTPGSKGMKGAIAKAEELLHKTENAFMPMQFNNPAYPEYHRKTTAEEIWRDTNGEVDIIIAGVGTGGTLTGVAEVLKLRNPDCFAIAVEPADSPVISGGAPGPHPIQGIGAGFIPDNLNKDIVDEVFHVTGEEATHATRLLAQKEGILAGISSGAAAHAAFEIAKRQENHGKTIVVILPDTGERYLSTPLFS